MGSIIQEIGLKEELGKIYNLLKIVGIVIVLMAAVDIIDNLQGWF